MTDGFDAAERKILRKASTPEKVQRFLDEEIGYNHEPSGATCRSPRRVLRDRVAHCMEGALFGAAALGLLNFPPLLLDLEADRDDDHVLAIFRWHGHWGAVAKSNYSGLRFREPVYRNLRELVMSYFEHYYNLAGEKTLRRYSKPVGMTRFERLHWVTTEEDLWAIPEYLVEIPHTRILEPGRERTLNPVDPRLLAAGLVGRQQEEVRSQKSEVRRSPRVS